MAENFSNDFQTTLSAAIADGLATALSVVSGTGAPSANFRIRVGNEYMLVTSTGAGTNWTVTRGIEGSTATAHVNGTVVAHVTTTGGFQQYITEQLTGGAVAASFASLVVAGALTVSGLTAGSISFAGVDGLISQDNANLFWDDTNKRLGVGTNAPAKPLHVFGEARFSQAGAERYRASFVLAGGTLVLNAFDDTALAFIPINTDALSFRFRVLGETNQVALQMVYGPRVLVAGASDDGVNALQVSGNAKVSGAALWNGGLGSLTAYDAGDAFDNTKAVSTVGVYPLSFHINGVFKAGVATTGNFIVGATTDDAANKLQVTGTIAAKHATGNGITITPVAAASTPSIAATGSDTNINILLSPKGTGNVGIGHNALGATRLNVYGPTDTGALVVLQSSTGTAGGSIITLVSAAVTGDQFGLKYATSVSGLLSHYLQNSHASGSVAWDMLVLGTGNAFIRAGINGGRSWTFGLDNALSGDPFMVSSGGTLNAAPQFQVTHTDSPVNYVSVTGAASGNSPVISAAGSGADLDLTLTPKGAGRVRFGSFTAAAAEAFAGTIEMKDAGGTARKVAVFA